MAEVVLDTHALVWMLTEPDRLSPAARTAIESAPRLHVPSICVVELIYLAEKGRLPAALTQ